MNKVKKAVNDMRNYLGKDTQGAALLEKISRIANDVRKECAAAQKESADLRTLLGEANAARSAACGQVQDLSTELGREHTLLRQRDRDAAAEAVKKAELQRQLAKLLPTLDPPTLSLKTPLKLGTASNTPDELPSGLKDRKAITAAFHSLRKDLTVAPPPEPVGKELEPREICYMYYLEDIVQDYSPASMMTLGRFVAVMAMIGIPSVIATAHVFSYFVKEDRFPDKTLKPFYRWFRHAVKTPEYQAKIYDSSLIAEEIVAKGKLNDQK